MAFFGGLYPPIHRAFPSLSGICGFWFPPLLKSDIVIALIGFFCYPLKIVYFLESSGKTLFYDAMNF